MKGTTMLYAIDARDHDGCVYESNDPAAILRARDGLKRDGHNGRIVAHAPSAAGPVVYWLRDATGIVAGPFGSNKRASTVAPFCARATRIVVGLTADDRDAIGAHLNRTGR